MGRSQAVRQRVLVPLFGGSNPSVPEHIHPLYPNTSFLFNKVLFQGLILEFGIEYINIIPLLFYIFSQHKLN